MSYQRVIPRDFFNESKLLKCLGKLSIKGESLGIKIEESGGLFNIELLEDWAVLTVTNYRVTVNDNIYTFGTRYNSKDPYPLVMLYEYEEIEVLNENGEITKEFKDGLEKY